MGIGETEVGELRDHIVAVQNLLLSHIAAVEGMLVGSAAATIDIAGSQSEAHIRQGRSAVAIRLSAMIDDLRLVCELPAND